MNKSQQPVVRRFAIITAAVIAVIIYGSLFPFEFHHRTNSVGPLGALLSTYHSPTSRGDLVANILLYVPLGLFFVQALTRLSLLMRVFVVACTGLLLSVSIELAQAFDQGRASAMVDVYANTAGTLLGALAEIVLGRKLRLPWMRRVKEEPFAALMIACWLGYRLFPYVPVIDLHKYWRAIKPLVVAPKLLPVDLYRHVVIWLALALLLEALIGIVKTRWAFAVFVLSVLFARIFIFGTTLSPADVSGGVIAILVWVPLLSRLRSRALLVAVMFAGVVLVQALEPFHFNATPHSFGWVPFRGFMEGSIEVNIRSFFEKVFTYGALVWLVVRTGYSLTVAALLSGAFVLCLRIGQTYIPGRSPEITDLVILLAVAVMMRLLAVDSSWQSHRAAVR